MEETFWAKETRSTRTEYDKVQIVKNCTVERGKGRIPEEDFLRTISTNTKYIK